MVHVQRHLYGWYVSFVRLCIFATNILYLSIYVRKIRGEGTYCSSFSKIGIKAQPIIAIATVVFMSTCRIESTARLFLLYDFLRSFDPGLSGTVKYSFQRSSLVRTSNNAPWGRASQKNVKI
jgi:hypothetical protein